MAQGLAVCTCICSSMHTLQLATHSTDTHCLWPPMVQRQRLWPLMALTQCMWQPTKQKQCMWLPNGTETALVAIDGTHTVPVATVAHSTETVLMTTHSTNTALVAIAIATRQYLGQRFGIDWFFWFWAFWPRPFFFLKKWKPLKYALSTSKYNSFLTFL